MNKTLLSFLLATTFCWGAESQEATSTAPENEPPYFQEADGKSEEAADEEVKISGVAKNLQEALIGAYDNNPTLLSLRREILARNEKAAQAYSAFMPRVDLNGSIALSESHTSGSSKDASSSNSQPSDANQRKGGIRITQNLFKGGADVAALRSADSETKASWAKMKTEEQKILLAVIDAYLEIIKRKSETELYEANRLAVQTNLDAAESKLKIGEETKTQVAIAEAKLAEADARLQIAKAAHTQAVAKFFTLTGLKPADNIERPSVATEIPADLKQIVEEAKASNPEVIQASLEYTAAKHNKETLNEAYVPTIDLEASSTRSEGRSRTLRDGEALAQGNNFSTDNQIALSVKYNLFDGGRTSSKKRELHQVSASKRVAIEAARMRAYQEAIQAYESYMAGLRNVKNYAQQVESGKVSLEGTQQEMSVGTKILQDVLQRQTELLEAQAKLVEAEKSVLLEGFKILAAMGRLDEKLLKLPVKSFDVKREFGFLVPEN
jgi:outer membrane protein